MNPVFFKAMKAIILGCILIVSVLPATAQPAADSLKLPWATPFSISLGAGFNENIEYDTIVNGVYRSSFATSTGSESLFLSTDSDYSRDGNSITFNSPTFPDGGEYSGGQGFTITFDSTFDSILSVSCGYNQIYNAGHAGYQKQYGFSFNRLKFDSVSLIYPDSSLNFATFSYSYDAGYDAGPNTRIQYHERSTSVTSISLGGIFRPTILRAWAGVSSQVACFPLSLSSFPNPFSRFTTVSFASEAGFTDVSILNSLGDEISHLYSGEVMNGTHSFVWEPDGVAPGMYECIVRANGRVRSLPIMLEP